MTVRTLPSLLVLIAVLSSAGSRACELRTVRDAAFQEPRDTHRIVLFTSPGDQGVEEREKTIAGWLQEYGESLNLEFLRVDVAEEGIDWAEYGIPGPPPTTPVTVLVGTNQRTRKNFFIHHWEEGPSRQDLDRLVSSPFLQAIVTPLLEGAAVIAYSTAGENSTGDLLDLLKNLEIDWDRREKRGIALLGLDRSDPANEPVLSFLGISPNDPDWVAVIFGRGKVMDPWIGEDIEESELNAQIETLVGECNCLQTAGSLGVDLPMVWTAEMDAKVVPLHEPSEDSEMEVSLGILESGFLDGPAAVVLSLMGMVFLLGTGLLCWRNRRFFGLY